MQNVMWTPGKFWVKVQFTGLDLYEEIEGINKTILPA